MGNIFDCLVEVVGGCALQDNFRWEKSKEGELLSLRADLYLTWAHNTGT